MSLRNYILKRHEVEVSKQDAPDIPDIPDTWEFPYVGYPERVILLPGLYKFECWGAQGGSYNDSLHGGPGGYSYCTATINNPIAVNICVGQEGIKSSTPSWGGWNGGGSQFGNSVNMSGGGATDFSTGNIPTFEENYTNKISMRDSDSISKRFLVAGGGSGASWETSTGTVLKSISLSVSVTGTTNNWTFTVSFTCPSDYLGKTYYNSELPTAEVDFGSGIAMGVYPDYRLISTNIPDFLILGSNFTYNGLIAGNEYYYTLNGVVEGPLNDLYNKDATLADWSASFYYTGTGRVQNLVLGKAGGGESGLGSEAGTLYDGYAIWNGGNSGGGGYYGGNNAGGSGYIGVGEYVLLKAGMGVENINILQLSYDSSTKKYLILITFKTPSDFYDFENSYIDLSVYTNTYSGDDEDFLNLEDTYYHLHDMKPHFKINGEIDSTFNEGITDWIFIEETGMMRNEHLAIYIDNDYFKPNTSYSIVIEGTSDSHLESFDNNHRDPWGMYVIYYYRRTLQPPKDVEIGITEGNTVSGDMEFFEPNGTTSIGHYGNGYARITKLPDPIVLPEDHFRLESTLENTAKLSIAVNSLEYLTLNGTWEELGTKEVSFGGDKGPLYIRGKSSLGTVENFEGKNSMLLYRYCPSFVFSINDRAHSVICKGDIRYLVDYEDPLNADCSNARFCYLFQKCYYLTGGPKLPITKLCSNLYEGMFSECISLITAPELPALVMESYCYYKMFYNSGLLLAPKLPSRVMAPHCYDSMFMLCASLVIGPDLMATILVDSCYKDMFAHCYGLKYLKAMFITPVNSTTTYTASWLGGAGDNATFIRNVEYSIPTNVDYGISLYFTTIQTYSEPFHFESKTARTLRFEAKTGTAYDTLEYALGSDENNLSAWKSLNNEVSFGGDLGNMYIRGLMTIGTATSSNASANTGGFKISGEDQIVAAGDLRYIINKNNPRSVTGSNVRIPHLFYDLRYLICAPETYFTVLSTYCYWMLYSFTGLYNAPELPVTTLANDCYSYMYTNCYSLRLCVRSLPATTLKLECYFRMFQNCRFTTTCDLPATTLAEGCYGGMFYGCINLISAPTLPATRLYRSCYWHMFGYCTSLINAPALPATTLLEACYLLMFASCRSLRTAPILSATSLVSRCYEEMFSGCSNLNYIKMMALSISSPESYFNEWVLGVSNSGTFIKNSRATWSNDIGVDEQDGIFGTYTKVVPSGWTVETASS